MTLVISCCFLKFSCDFCFFSQLKLVIWLKMVDLQRMTLVECFLINSMQRWRLYLLHLRWSSRGWTTSRKHIHWHWKINMFHCFGPPKIWRLAMTCRFFATSEWGRDEINFKNVGRIWLDWKVGDNTTVYQYPPCSTRCSARVQAFSEHGAFSRPTSAHTDVSPRPFPRMLQPAMATVDAPTPNP